VLTDKNSDETNTAVATACSNNAIVRVCVFSQWPSLMHKHFRSCEANSNRRRCAVQSGRKTDSAHGLYRRIDSKQIIGVNC